MYRNPGLYNSDFDIKFKKNKIFFPLFSYSSCTIYFLFHALCSRNNGIKTEPFSKNRTKSVPFDLSEQNTHGQWRILRKRVEGITLSLVIYNTVYQYVFDHR